MSLFRHPIHQPAASVPITAPGSPRYTLERLATLLTGLLGSCLFPLGLVEALSLGLRARWIGLPNLGYAAAIALLAGGVCTLPWLLAGDLDPLHLIAGFPKAVGGLLVGALAAGLLAAALVAPELHGGATDLSRSLIVAAGFGGSVLGWTVGLIFASLTISQEGLLVIPPSPEALRRQGEIVGCPHCGSVHCAPRPTGIARSFGPGFITLSDTPRVHMICQDCGCGWEE